MPGRLTPFKSIIFDLGGVILNLNPQATVDGFKKLGIVNVEEFYSTVHHDSFIIDFEMGKIPPDVFRNKIKAKTQLPLSDKQIDKAWSAMLLDIPKERIELLYQLKSRYHIFLLSNTNAIHIHHFNTQVKQVHGINGIEELFEKCYYSSDIGYRKPDTRAFQYVLEDAHLIPGETLFVDDFESNIRTAKRLGFQVFHLENEMDITRLFS